MQNLDIKFCIKQDFYGSIVPLCQEALWFYEISLSAFTCSEYELLILQCCKNDTVCINYSAFWKTCFKKSNPIFILKSILL